MILALLALSISLPKNDTSGGSMTKKTTEAGEKIGFIKHFSPEEREVRQDYKQAE